MRFFLLVLWTAALALALHLLVGWPWVLLAAILGGYLRSAWVGLGGVGLAWLGLLLWNHLAYPGPVGRMTETVGELFGALPGWAIPALSLLVGLFVGGLGGLIGMLVRHLVRGEQSLAWGANPAPARE